MSRKDYQAFASNFLDLWQEQMARAMADSDVLQAMMKQMQAGAFGYEQQKTAKDDRNAANASGAGPHELDDLRQRLAACERKIIKLEATIDRLKEKAKTRPGAKRGAGASRPAAKPAKRAATKAKTKNPTTKKTTPTGRKRAVKRSK